VGDLSAGIKPLVRCGVEAIGHGGTPLPKGHIGCRRIPNTNRDFIEPWKGYASPEGFDGEQTEKPGIVLIPADKTQRFKMAIAV
jgi:hypothetical protein